MIPAFPHRKIMRLFVVTLLAFLLVVSSVPQWGMAGAPASGHGCAACPEDMPSHDMEQEGGNVSSCAQMGLCVLALPPVDQPAAGNPAPAASRTGRPGDTTGRATTLPFDLPPPRS
ncbi:hypothetical protein C8N44_12953 [Allosediminivita pacifica]|uniref:Uncharacterized protein n=1 Tax=Allosediminivita pacifica TaxID=1267769 RepID=A0A2T6AC32_9RHOB|nr:hypothetical protein C8N44_12953 [Allosediminivita pacifica]